MQQLLGENLYIASQDNYDSGWIAESWVAFLFWKT